MREGEKFGLCMRNKDYIPQGGWLLERSDHIMKKKVGIGTRMNQRAKGEEASIEVSDFGRE